MSAMKKGDVKARHYWIVERLKERGKNQVQLARAINRPASRITDIIQGKRNVQPSELRAFAAFLELPFEVVLARLEVNKPKAEIPERKENINPRSVTRPIRVIGRVQGGLFREAFEWPPGEQFEVSMPISSKFEGKAVFALEVVGPSVNQKYPEGSYVTCVNIFDLGPGYALEHEKFYVVNRRNREGLVETTIKELRIGEDGQHWLWPRSDHPDFQQPWQAEELGFGEHFEHEDPDIMVAARVIGHYTQED